MISGMQEIQFAGHAAGAFGYHPLANPHVVRVVPFWLGGQTRLGDLAGPEPLFETERRIGPDCLLHLDRDRVASGHGDAVADILDGRTGLYVVVDDIEAVRHGVRGRALSDVSANGGILEYVIETPAGLIIFAQDEAAASNAARSRRGSAILKKWEKIGKAC